MEYDQVYENNTLRELQWFTKKRGKLVGEEELVNIDILQLREIFGVTDPFKREEDDLYDEAYDPYMSYKYEIEPYHVKLLQPFVRHKIKLDKYDYFIAAYARG